MGCVAQWSSGRMTTSKLACCIGFFESYTAGVMNIPRSLQSHSRAIAAWHQLRARPPTSWSFLCEKTVFIDSTAEPKSNPWSVDSSSTSMHQYAYNPIENTSKLDVLFNTASAARLAWGSAQEATAVLAALNYFASIEPGTIVKEAGLLTFEALQESIEHLTYLEQESVLRDILHSQQSDPMPTGATATKTVDTRSISTYSLYRDLSTWIFGDKTLPLLGASPDGIIQHADGRVEVLEVKCTSPFMDATKNKKPQQQQSAAAVEPRVPIVSPAPAMTVMKGYGRGSGGRDLDGSEGLPVWHVPQLQLEMLCVGAHCRSAVVVVLCITGARIFGIERDDQVCSMQCATHRIYACCITTSCY